MNGQDPERNRANGVLRYSHRVPMVFIVLALLALPEYRRWESYGGGPEQIRYSSLRQIHRGNVRDLEVAWTYDTGETGGSRPSPSSSTACCMR